MSSILDDLFDNAFGKGASPKIEIQARKKEFEDNLNDMWANYGRGCISQLPEYQKQVRIIKEAGCRVMRNSVGKHKIII